MKLLGSPTSPYVRKVRVFALERGIPFELAPEDPWKKTERLLSLNPLGKVPVIVLDDGRAFYDSLSIIEVMDDLGAADGRMLPAPGEERWKAMQWHAMAHGVIDAVVNRLLETRRPEDKQMPERMKAEEARFSSILAHAEKRAAELAISGDRPGFAALMIGVALRYTDFRYMKDWRASAPRLASLVEALQSRPSFLQTDPPA